MIMVTPQEYKYKYYDGDINQHLYTWTPLTLANLIKTSGLKIISSETLKHKWSPYYYYINKLFGSTIFNLLSNFYSIIKRQGYQVITIAQKPK